jgi:hypothetical protein
MQIRGGVMAFNAGMRTLVLTALILAIPRWSTAEINMAESIEWLTADSDRVVVGKVAKLDTRTETAAGSTTIWFYTTIAVSQTLKGAPARTVDLVVRHVFGDNHPGHWKQKGREVLLFLVPSRVRATQDGDHKAQYDDAPFALRAGRQGNDAYALDGSARTYTRTFAVLSKREPLLAAVKAAASSKATRSLAIEVPLDSAAGRALWGGSSVLLDVPIDAALEQLAIRWIGAPQGHVRDRGVEALAHFRSPANIQRLESLLQDSATHDVIEGGRPPVRRYFVRKRAHDTLVAWGVPHTTPPMAAPPGESSIDTPVPKP